MQKDRLSTHPSFHPTTKDIFKLLNIYIFLISCDCRWKWKNIKERVKNYLFFRNFEQKNLHLNCRHCLSIPPTLFWMTKTSIRKRSLWQLLDKLPYSIPKNNSKSCQCHLHFISETILFDVFLVNGTPAGDKCEVQ